MTDNATLRCRDEGDGESEDLHYGRGRQQIIMKDKNFCGNCKGGGLLHPWALSARGRALLMGVCSLDKHTPWWHRKVGEPGF